MDFSSNAESRMDARFAAYHAVAMRNGSEKSDSPRTARKRTVASRVECQRMCPQSHVLRDAQAKMRKPATMSHALAHKKIRLKRLPRRLRCRSARCPDRSWFRRSEEHKSELQSLMRISNA